MYKRIRLNLAFNDEDPRDDIVEEVLRHLGDAVVIEEGQVNEERGYILLEDCYHNSPNEPCIKTDRWEVGKGKVI